MQISTADLEHPTGKCRSRPSISDYLRRPHSTFFSLVPMDIPVFGTRLPSSAISILLPLWLNIRRERREEGGEERTLFCATRSPILSKMLAERISALRINEKAPTTLVFGLLGCVFCLCGCPRAHHRGLESERVFPLSLPPVLRPSFSRPLRSFSKQSRPELLTPVTPSVEGHWEPVPWRGETNLLGAQITCFFFCSNRSLTRWKRVTHFVPSHLSFFKPNLFFFRRVSHSPPAAPLPTCEKRVLWSVIPPSP